MRLWTLHPKYLDAKGLVALWREGLLAKAVLEGKTKGYVNHPQLIRFREQRDPLLFLCEFLREVLAEASRRGYTFNAAKLPGEKTFFDPVEETEGQLLYEWQHLLKKLSKRDHQRYMQFAKIQVPAPHPLFTIVPGEVRSWEKV